MRWLLAPNASLLTLDGTRTYIVGWSAPVVIDPGPPRDEHVSAVIDALDGVTPAAILVTHRHSDHAGAAPELARRTGGYLWVGDSETVSGSCPQRVVSRDDTVETDAGVLRVLHTPGHTRDHLSVHLQTPTRSAAFVGDLLLGAGDTTLVASPEGDVADYLESLARIEALAAEVMFPAHGPPIENPQAAIDVYRRHRLARVEQVRGAMLEFGEDPGELVQRIYGQRLPKALLTPAIGSIAAAIEYIRARPV